jgi:molybdenum cofactor guanylyltransferase
VTPSREYPGRPSHEEPIGVILAGGIGRRIGGSKALVELFGQPLIRYPLAAMQAVLDDVAVIAKPDTELPSLPGVAVWIEAAPGRHPLVGLLEALRLAAGRPILACAVDLPLVSPELIAAISEADPGGGAAVIASCAGETQPLLGCYQPQAAAPLTRTARSDVALRDAVAAIAPRLFEVADPELLLNVNAPEDLLRAAAMLERISRR